MRLILITLGISIIVLTPCFSMPLQAFGQPLDSSGTTFRQHPNSSSPFEYRITRWTAENGLPQNTIKALLQTRDGYLWIGTLKGLARFDGLNFKIFDRANTPEMVHESINELVEDQQDGSLWIATGNGLLQYRDHRFRNYYSREPVPRGIGVLSSAKEGGVWFSPRDGQVGLARDGHVQCWSFGPDSPGNQVRYLSEASSAGQIDLGVQDGLFRFDVKSQSLMALPLPPETNIMISISRQADGSLWLCGSGGIWHQEKSEWKRLFEERDISLTSSSVTRTHDGQIWACKKQHRENSSRLYRLVDGKLEPFVALEFPSDVNFHRLLEDSEGNIWIGTRTGLYRLQPRWIMVYSTQNGLRSDDVLAVTISPNGTIWLGTADGVSAIQNANVTNLPLFPGNLNGISSFLADKENRLWAGIRPEPILSCYANGEWHNCEAPRGLTNAARIKAFYEDRRGRFWASTDLGVFCEDTNSSVSFYAGNRLSNRDVRTIYQDHAGNMWFGTYGGGLNRLRERDGKITVFKTNRGTFNNHAWWIHEDEEGVFWIATEDGLNRFVPPQNESREQKAKSGNEVHLTKAPLDTRHSALETSANPFFTFTTQHGLRDNVINNIQEDDYGYLWLSGLRGVYRIARKELNEVASGKLEKVHCVTFGEADGMLNCECNGGDNQPSGCKDHNGHIWFPTAKGVVEIDPKEMLRTEAPPPVVIEQVIADDEVIRGDGKKEKVESKKQESESVKHPSKLDTRRSSPPLPLQLAPGHARVLEIRYTANTFTAPEHIAFKYQLQGYDQSWRSDNNNRRVVFYTGLRPGSYTFRVKACNNHGYWNEIGDSFAFSIAPHFWETWPFYAGVGAMVIASGLGLHHQRVRGLRRVQALEQQRALVEERARIAQDLHDELGANLTGIALQLDLASEQTSMPDDTKTNLANIAHRTRGEVDTMREVIWAMNPQCDDTESFSSFIGQYAENYLSGAGLRCRLEFPSDGARPLNAHTRHQLFLIVKEALHNVVRHARATEVNLCFEQTTNRIRLTVADNGCGMPRTNGSCSGRGIKNMQKRARQLGGEVTITTLGNAGTQIEITLPIPSNVNPNQPTQNRN